MSDSPQTQIQLRTYTTAEDAIEASRHQRPGIVVVVGPEGGRDKLISPAPGDCNRTAWIVRELGYKPSLYEAYAAVFLAVITGQPFRSYLDQLHIQRLTPEELYETWRRGKATA